MSTLYINTQGAVLKKEEHRFTVSKDGKTLVSVPDFKVERILVYGNVQITTQALKFALKNNIPITFLTVYGRFVGTAIPSFSKNILLRIKQFSIMNDPERKLDFAKSVVESKISNSIIMLKRFFKHTEIDPENIHELKALKNSVKNVNSIGQLQGTEGTASSLYFREIKRLFAGKILISGRNYHPAKDAFNSLLNFLYSLISNEMLGILYNAGFDPYLGFLHSVEYGRTSLTYDIIEPFRSPIADSVAVKLFSMRIISEEDFEPHKLYGYILKNNARRIVLAHYEQKMENTFTYKNKQYNFRKLMHEEGEKLKKAVLEGKTYEPFKLTR